MQDHRSIGDRLIKPVSIEITINAKRAIVSTAHNPLPFGIGLGKISYGGDDGAKIGKAGSRRTRLLPASKEGVRVAITKRWQNESTC